MRAIWLQHSEQIITDVYNSKMPYFQDAVDFTLAEARQAATITIDVASPETQPLLNEEDMGYSSDFDCIMNYTDSDEEYGLEAAIQVKDS
jgi:hypothetical protein